VNAVETARRTSPAPTCRRLTRHVPDDRVTLALWGVVGALAVLYAGLVAAHLDRIITDLLWNSDYASGFTLAQTLAHAGSDGNTTISTTGAWMDLWFGLITAHLPLHRQLWEISPTILFLASALVIGRAVWLLAGLAAGVAATLAVAMASPWALSVFLAPVAHNTVYPTTAVLGGVMPWVVRHRDRGRVAWCAIVAVGALLLGTSLASDKLVLVTAIVPLTVTAVAALWQRSRDVRLAAGGVLVVIVLAIPVEIAVNAIMAAAGYAITAPKLVVAAVSSWPFHLRLFLDGLRDFSGSYLVSGYHGPLRPELGIACSVVLVLVMLTFIAGGVRALLALATERSLGADRLGSVLHVGYWFASALVTVIAFVCTTADGGNASNHNSYFLTLIFAVAATVPLLLVAPQPTGRRMARWGRRLAPLALAVFAAGSVVGVASWYVIGTATPLAGDAATIVNLARADHATYGYAGYWDASSLTWETREGVEVRPLLQCTNPNPTGASVCPFLLMRTASWYRPVHRRTFLIVDPDNAFVTKLPTHLGRPVAVHHIGELIMYVYAYDIASRLGPYPVWPG
jgi:hypothetical protein